MEEAQDRPYQRKLKRYQLTALVDIHQQSDNQFVGRLVNIHTEGLMVIGNFPFAEDQSYQLNLQLPKNFSERSDVPLVVECLWTRKAQEDGDTLWSGFGIVECSDNAKQDIEALIDEMGV